MSKATKWAVETAKEDMNGAIRVKMGKWDKAHPPKAKEIDNVVLAEIAIKDPVWLKQVIAHVRKGRDGIDLYRSDFEKFSPNVRAFLEGNVAIDIPRNKMRGEIESELRTRRDHIVRAAIIGDCDGATLLKQVNDFCK